MSLTATPTPRNIASLAFLSTTAVCKRQLSRTPKQREALLVSHFHSNASQLTQRYRSTSCRHEQFIYNDNKKSTNITGPLPCSNTDLRRKRAYAKVDAREADMACSSRFRSSALASKRRFAQSLVREYGTLSRCSSVNSAFPSPPSSSLGNTKKRHYSTPPSNSPLPSSPAPQNSGSSNFELCPSVISDAILRGQQETQQQASLLSKIKIDRFPSSRYTFSTYDMVSKFEKTGRYTRSQSLAITECIHHFLKGRLGQYQGQLLTKSDLENESYLFKAALSELRTELQIHRRNDTANLKSDVNAVMREVDSLHIKLREDMSNLKSDIAMEMNTRKAEMSESAKKTEFGMLEANNRYTVELSDVRTEIEQMKWETTKKAAAFGYCAIATLLLFGYCFMSGGSVPNGDVLDNQTQASLNEDQEAQNAGSTNTTKVLEGPQCGIAGPGM